MAGRSSEPDMSSVAGSLSNMGVKIIAVGFGGSFDRSQLSTMASSSSHVLTSATFNLAGVSQGVGALITKGTGKAIMMNSKCQCEVKIAIYSDWTQWSKIQGVSGE